MRPDSSGLAIFRSGEKHSTASRVFPYTSFVLYRFLLALQQNTAQSRLLYLLNMMMGHSLPYYPTIIAELRRPKAEPHTMGKKRKSINEFSHGYHG